MAIYKNVASQKVAVFAYDDTDGDPQTGDAGNITAQISKDGAATAATDDTNPTELDATDAKGIYIFDLTQAETNADLIVISPVSSTSNIALDPVIIYTTPGDSTALDANVVEISGSATAANNAEIVYDTDFATNYSTANDKWQTESDLQSVDGNAAAAGRLRQWITSWTVGDVSSDGGTTITIDSVSVDDQFNGDLLLIFSGTGSQQARRIIDCDATGNTLTIDHAFGISLDATSDYIIIPDARVDVEAINGLQSTVNNLEDAFDGTGYDIGGIDVSELNAIVDDLLDAGRLDALIDAIKAKTDALPASPAAVGSEMALENDAITAAKFDESTAFPLKAADTGATAVARTGADSDTLETLSDEVAGLNDPSAADIRAEIDSNSTQLAAIVGDTNELQGDWANGGRLDLILDELTTQGDTNEGKLDTIDGVVDSILTDTGTTLPGTLTTIEGKVDTVDGVVDSILTDTAEIGAAGAGLTEAGGDGDHLTEAGGTGDQFTAIPWNASWDAEVQSEVADALEETIADSIPADGTRPSVKQGIYMLTQFMTERSISSTTMTIKKPDGSTSLFTLTLDDDTTPTSITRAT